MNYYTYKLCLGLKKAKQILSLSEAVIKGQISRYPSFVGKFENRFARYIGREFGLTFCNGTSSIEAALFAAGVGKGDEVIVPSCTFHASIDPIVNLGATPVFADVDKDSFTLCPADLEKKLSPKTKVVIVVHLFGIPADIDEIYRRISGRNITLIEDVSHAHGANIGGRMCGSLGDYGVFSLQGDKAVAGGEGGIVVTDDNNAWIRMSMWGHFNRHDELFHKIGAEAFSPVGVGYKRRMHPLSALLAGVDLDYLERINKFIRHNVAALDKELDGLKSISITRLPNNFHRGGFFSGYPVCIQKDGINVGDVIDELFAVGVTANRYPFPLHHQMSVYTDLAYREAILRGERCLPRTPDKKWILPVTDSLPNKMLLLPRKELASISKSRLSRIRGVFSSF